MRIRNLSFALLFAGTAVVGLSRPTFTVAAAPVNNIAAAPVEEHADDTYLQKLRETRRLLNEAKGEFDKDTIDKMGHRKEVLENLDKAINAVDTETKEYMDSMKK